MTIIIGAGSAGTTLAARLSEIKNVTVLLIEAGIKEYPIMDIPGILITLEFIEKINWAYKTESSDKYCLGFEGHRCSWPRGKVMGGSSILNFMIATRGSKDDFNKWANITGDDSWSFKEMLKYFKKLENYLVKGMPVKSELHGKNGPIPITVMKGTELSRVLINAGKELGFPTINYNDDSEMEFGYLQSNILNGERWSTNRAYLHPIKNRKNPFLSRSSTAQKILIDKTKSAYGVQFLKDQKIYTVKAKKEIILSAGAIGSPQLLMLSGIRPEQHLCDLGIDIIKNSPVGENLMDHISYSGLSFKLNTSLDSGLNLLDPRNPDIRNYVTKRMGSLTTFVVGALGYFAVDDPNKLSTQPDIEFLFGDVLTIVDPVFSKALGVSKDYQKKLQCDQSNNSLLSIWPMITNPKSRGKLLLRSRNPNDKPKLYPNYLDDPHDIKILIEGIRMAIKLSETKAFKKYGLQMFNVPLPCESYKYDSDEYWECAIRTYTTTIYHICGTCKMGQKNDNSAVLNSRSQVSYTHINISLLRCI